MLCGEDLGWGHQAGLHAVAGDDEHAEQCHESFAAADVALHETVHLLAAFEVGPYFVYDTFLRPSGFEVEVVLVERGEGCARFLELYAFHLCAVDVA